MKQIKRSEVARTIAEGIMGWDYNECVFGNIQKPLPEGVDANTYHNFNPTSDANHAIEALEAWCKENGSATLVVNDAGMKERCQRAFLRIHYDCIPVSESCHETSLPMAICTALCSALMGEQLTISEED